MEARTKIIAAVAVIMMCAAGLVGAGYAYTASTTNDANSATAEYITLTQSGYGAYDFVDGQKIYWDSKDLKVREGDALIGKPSRMSDGSAGTVAIDDIVTQYKFTNGASIMDIEDVTSMKLGDALTLNPTYSAAANLPTIFIDITPDKFIAPAAGAGSIYMKVTDNSPSEVLYRLTTDNTFTQVVDQGEPLVNKIAVHGNAAQNPTAYRPLTVEFYYGLDTATEYGAGFGLIVEHNAGVEPAIKPLASLLNNASLVFTISVPGINPGIVLDKYNVTMAPQGSATVNAILPAGWEGSVAVESADTQKATVAVNNNVITITAGNADATTTITVTYTHNGVEYSETIGVTVTSS